MRDNYYILLNLDPEEEDSSTIEKAITRKQHEWARMRNHPSKGTWANQCLSQIPNIRRTLMNAESRKAEAEEAVRQLHVQQKEKFVELDQAIATLSAKGFISKQEIEKLLKRTAFKGFSRNDIEGRIKVPIKKEPAVSPEAKISPLDLSQTKKIDQDLEMVQKKDLYDFLGLQPNSTLETLQARTDQLYKELRQKSARDASYTATQELLGQCKQIFKSEDQRKRYHRTLDEKRFTKLNKQIDVAGLNKEISAAVFEHLVKEGTAMGLSKKEVIEQVKKQASKKGWMVQLPAEDSVIHQLISCGVCNALNAPKDKNCTHCGFPLQVQCPGCKANSNSNTTFCAKCGYSIADMPNALPLLRDAKSAITSGDYDLAEQLFNQANEFWKNHPDILAGKSEIKERLQHLGDVLKEVERLAQQKQFYLAKKFLSKLKKQSKGDLNDLPLISSINKRIVEAERWLSKARSSASNRERESAYFEALNLSTDCIEAKEGLAKLPIAPPKMLSAAVQGAGIRLQWAPVMSKFQLSYRLVRKIGGIPTHAKDGQVITNTAQVSFIDNSVEAGIPYYYAVFTLRNEKVSEQSTCSTPLIIVTEVKELVALPADGSISLAWEAPKHAQAIEVWFSEGAIPRGRGDGNLLSSVRPNGAVHSSLLNEVMYGYLVIAVFKDTHGRELLSKGKCIQAKATSPPQPVQQLTVHKSKQLLEFSWEQGANKVEIFASSSPFVHQFGEILPYSQLGNLGTSLTILENGRATYRMPHHGVQFFLPVSIKGQIAVLGQQTHALHLEEVGDLEGSMEGENLRVKWTFPPQVKRVELLCGDPLAPVDGIRFVVTWKEYHTGDAGYVLDPFILNSPEVLIKVRTILETPDAILAYSEGRELQIKVKKTTVRFSVQKQGMGSFFSRNLRFQVKLEVDGWIDETLQLVVKENNRLISLRDPDRHVLMDISGLDLMQENSAQYAVTYKPSSRAVKNLFFSLIPPNSASKDNLEIEGNGKKISL